MADNGQAILSFARDNLLPYIIEAANMIRGVPKDVEDMKNELENIQVMIYDADRAVDTADRGTLPDDIREKVNLLIEAAFRMEDIIDEYMIHHHGDDEVGGCVGLPCEPGDFIKTVILRLQIAQKIQVIKSQVRAINESSKKESDFHINHILKQEPSSSTGNQSISWKDLRNDARYMDEADIVGFEKPTNELVGWLIKETKERSVISVVGTGGVGKTTLARKVFGSGEVIRHFECRVAVTVWQSYNLDGVLRDLLQAFNKEQNQQVLQEISAMLGDSLIDKVRRVLQPKRYFVLFDDVWDENFWDRIKHAVFDNKKGSRILIISRSLKVAKSCAKSSRILTLEPLTLEKSLELFYKKALQLESNECCPKDLMDISIKIVEVCKRLPLAIVVISGLVFRRDQSRVEWEDFYEELQRHQHISNIKTILGLSYHDLPYHLKPCFLYFGIYPEDYEIKKKRLVRQWIAEGFVKHEREKTSDKVAEKYLRELIDRNLVQVSSLDIEGRVKKLSHS